LGANAVNGVINIITKNAKDTHGAMLSVGGGNVDQGTGTFRYGGSNGRVSTTVFTAWASRAVPSFMRTIETFDDWRMAQAGFRADWDKNSRDTLTLQGDIYHEISGETTTFALYSPPSQVVADANGKFSGGNVMARWKRTVNEKSDFQIQAYYDYTRHFEPEFGETRKTFDVDFLTT